jgi:hypothetical protein
MSARRDQYRVLEIYDHPSAYRNKAIIPPPCSQSQALYQPIDDQMIPRRIHKVVIDSRDRNVDFFPTPSQYEVMLPEGLRDIAYVRLVSADVPFSRYIVHEGNNRLYVNETNPASLIEVTLTPSDYTPTELAIEMQRALNAACKCTYQVTYDPLNDGFVMTSSLRSSAGDAHVFELEFYGGKEPYGPQSMERAPKMTNGVIDKDPSGNTIYELVQRGQKTTAYKPQSAGKLIGFTPANFTTKLDTGEITVNEIESFVGGSKSGWTASLQPGASLTFKTEDDAGVISLVEGTVLSILTDRIIQVSTPLSELRTIKELYSTTIKSNARQRVEHDRYIVLHITDMESNIGIHSSTDKSFALINNPMVPLNNMSSLVDTLKVFDPPMANMQRIKIEFRDYYGTLYNFQNMDHRLELIFVTQQMTRKSDVS